MALSSSAVTLRQRRLVYYHDLLRELVIRDIKLLYKRSVLGLAWTMINPILQLIVFSFVFQSVLNVGIDQYASFAFTGLLIWTWSQSALFQATGLITGNRPLIRQPRFPSAILPIVTVTTGWIHFVLALPVLMVFLLMDGVKLQPIVLLLPIIMALQFVLTVSFAYPLAALNVVFRDTQHTLGVLLQLLMYLSPIFYQADMVPELFQPLYSLNPMVPLIAAYRAILLEGKSPSWISLGVLSLVTAVVLPIGHAIFRHQGRRFVEEL